jgi:hypothetical protein
MHTKPTLIAGQPSSSSAPAATTLPESLRVTCWRLATLSEAGYPDEAAAMLASRSDIDLHQATDLLVHGCPPETALRILA